MTDEPEVNPLRVSMIKNAIMQNRDEPITVENLSRFLPDDFDLDYDLDVAPLIADQGEAKPLSEVEFDAEAPAQEATPAIKFEGDAPEPVMEAAEPEPPAPTAEEIAAAEQRVRDSHTALAERRVSLIQAQGVERVARDKLGKVLGSFQAGFTPVSRDQLMRDYIASEQHAKAMRKAGMSPTPQGRPGKSYFDRTRFYGARGDAADFARQSPPLTEAQARALGGHGAGWKGNARNSYSASNKGRNNYDPRRGPVAKLPSEL